MTSITDTPTAADHVLHSESLDRVVELAEAMGLEVTRVEGCAYWDDPRSPGEAMVAHEVVQCVSVESRSQLPTETTATVILPAIEEIRCWVRVRAGQPGKFRQFRYRRDTNPYDSGIQVETFAGSVSVWNETQPMFTDDELIEFFGFMPAFRFLPLRTS